MGTEIRMVPAGWQHPADGAGHYMPLFDGTNFQATYNAWQEANRRWELGEMKQCTSLETGAFKWVPRTEDTAGMNYGEWGEVCPDPQDYTPQFTQKEATHFQVYENTTEGTPISPIFVKQEDLAHWMVTNDDATGKIQSMDDYERQFAAWMNTKVTSFAPVMSEEDRLLHVLFDEAGLSLTKVRNAIRNSEIRKALVAEMDKLKS